VQILDDNGGLPARPALTQVVLLPSYLFVNSDLNHGK
jgi:hypothetical protein